jgi:hypothetical protein
MLEKHNVHVFSSNYTLYGDFSRRVVETLRELTSDIEVYSIDECFADLKGFQHLGLLKYGHTMRDTVKQWTGIPVSVGIAPSKTLCKVANKLAKKGPGVTRKWPPLSRPFFGRNKLWIGGSDLRSRAAEAAPAIPALEPALGSHSCGALSPAQVPLL